MIKAIIVGNAIASNSHPSLHKTKMLLCQPLNEMNLAVGNLLVAIDNLGAGLHDKVLISSDGQRARELLNDDKSPVRCFVQGIIDQ